ncbi:MAG TPA: SDR family NAD(P)-dependent oxidoreductase [Candidatus Binataceae bacterium]|nr:SDR family NAD(P)-dependent oxidoreductase [Candidatus Binataceae bacterium]
MASSVLATGLGRVLEGKVAIITGAGRGIGEVSAKVFSQAGARLTLASRTGSELKKVAAAVTEMGGEAIPVTTDISDPKSADAMVKATVERYGTVDILINNAAIPGKDAYVGDVSLEQWEQAIRVDLFGTFNCCNAVVPILKQKRSGRIIILSSTIIHNPLVRKTHYVAAKTGLVGLCRALALELAPYNITVNTVTPGAVDGELLVNYMKRLAGEQNKPYEEFRKQFESPIPMKRFVQPEDIAYMEVFLSSELARNITGVEIPVDGGGSI